MIKLKNKNAFVMEVIVLIVVGIFAVVFFAGWMYLNGIINTQLLDFPVTAEDAAAGLNISEATANTFSYYNTGLAGLRLISFIFIFAFALATMIMAYYSKSHPIFLFIYFLIFIILVIFSIYVSSAYEGLLTNEALGDTIQTFTMTNFIMLRLPMWVSAIGFIGIIIMLARFSSGGNY